jgi:hypothetical protein
LQSLPTPVPSETTSPTHRHLTQVQMDEETYGYVHQLMGADTATRKDLLGLLGSAAE